MKEILPTISMEMGFLRQRGPTYNRSYPTSIERDFTHQGGPTESHEGGPTPSGLTESHEGGPTQPLYRGDFIVRESYPFRSYATNKSEVLSNLYDEGHYRPEGPISMYQVLPNLHEGGPT
ncbi:hypothetical protein Fot_11667 [Forsythia ovata]|uniref:Uncharacterized protein n=1 Tax=Forsythia ovata TaxID=205694 RepID=A0ABD1WKB4_9LAMI